jgi:hypothetical protein
VVSLYLCVCVCVCVCVVVSLAALRVSYPASAGVTNAGCLVVSVYDTHEAETLGRNWYTFFLTAGLNSYVPGGDNFLRNAGNCQSTEELSQLCFSHQCRSFHVPNRGDRPELSLK